VHVLSGSVAINLGKEGVIAANTRACVGLGAGKVFATPGFLLRRLRQARNVWPGEG